MAVSHDYDPERQCLTIRIDGAFDFSIHKAFRDAYTRPDGHPRSYVVDAAGTDRIDSSALGMLVLLCEEAGSRNAEVHLVNLSPALRHILRVAGFNRRATIH